MSVSVVKISTFLESNIERYMRILEKMVGINSHTDNRIGVNLLSEYTEEVFRSLGFIANRVPSINPEYGDHLVLVRPGRTNGRIGLVSHLDTVFPQEEERSNDFSWRTEGDRLYGPGTTDIKGGTVAILMMIEALDALFPEMASDINWIILLDASEETMSDDFGELCVRELEKNGFACLIFEGGGSDPAEISLVSSRKGRAEFIITVEGRGAHSGVNHQEGASAILQLADVIKHMARITDYSKDLTVNIGVISGGTVINRVPHQARAELEMRAFSPEIFQEGVEQILAFDGFCSVKSADGKYSCATKVELVRTSPAWPVNPGTERLVKLWRDAARQTRMGISEGSRGGLSDGNFTWNRVPTIDGLGPVGDNCHCSERSPDGSKDQEYVLRSSFVPKTVINCLAVLNLIENFLEIKSEK